MHMFPFGGCRLCPRKAEQVMKPEWPFQHTTLIKQGILSTFKSVDAKFTEVYREPCVMFCDQPTLRSGDAAYFMQRWSTDDKNTLISIDPDYDMEELLAPYQVLPAKTLKRLQCLCLSIPIMCARSCPICRVYTSIHSCRSLCAMMQPVKMKAAFRPIDPRLNFLEVCLAASFLNPGVLLSCPATSKTYSKKVGVHLVA